MTDLSLPYQPHSEPSRVAARVKRLVAPSELKRVERAIRASGLHGVSDRQIADRLDLSGNTVRPRRVELVNAGMVCQKLAGDGTPAVERSGGRTAAGLWVHIDFATQDERTRRAEDSIIRHRMGTDERARCARWVLDNDLWAPGRDNPPPAVLQQAVTMLYWRRQAGGDA